jgi:4-amino-4-deoxy-L-arabinose transferase-like glycosyltransferase
LRGLTVWLIYLTALLMFAGDDKKKKIGLWAAAIIGFYPDLIEISAMILSETLYIFLVCLLIYIFFSYFYKNEIRQLIVLGFLAGLATLARPPVLLFVPIIFFHFYKKKQLWRAVIFLLILIAVFLPWTVRNYMIYDKIMPFGVAGAFNFWIGNYHGGNGEQESKQEQYDFMASHETKEIPGESMRQFKAFLLNYPTEFIKLTFLRVNKYFSVIRPMGFWFYQTGISQLLFILSSAAASILLFVLGLAGFIKALKIKNSAVYYLMTFLILTPLIIFITVVETRYRFQIYPLLALLAGFFIMKSGSIKKWLLNDKIFLAALTIIMANGLLDLFLSFEKFKWRLGQFF